jgi:hypothetical protein
MLYLLRNVHIFNTKGGNKSIIFFPLVLVDSFLLNVTPLLPLLIYWLLAHLSFFPLKMKNNIVRQTNFI